jgi:hypothetical protein
VTEVFFIEYKHTGYCTWDVVVGCIDIAHIWSPHKGKRDYWLVRLQFNQRRGHVDFSKDRRFDTMEECKKYIHRCFKRAIKTLATYYQIIK